MSDVQVWSYIAGIVDGEGTITSTLHNERVQFVISISNTSTALFDWFNEKLPGFATTHPRGDGVSHWRVRLSKQREFLQKVIPYLVIKVEQALILLNYLETKEAYNHNWKVGLSAEEKQRRHDVRAQLTKLNRNKAKTIPHKANGRQRLSEAALEKEMR